MFNFCGSVVNDLESTNKIEAIKELIDKAPVFNHLKNEPEFFNAVIQREELKSTGFGHGIAVAHGKSPCVDTIHIALGISKKGINYNSIDKKPVHLLFLISTPMNKSQEYLKILASLMKIMRQAKLRKDIISTKNIEKIEKIMREKFNETYEERKLE